MSIQTEINRLIQAKSSLITQIEAKGVTVPADASLDDLAALVQAITGGEDLTEVLGDQDELIAQILTALEDKAAGGGGGSDLPEGYSRVDYIQFTDGQFVDTGIIGNQDTEISVCFTWDNSTQRQLLGCSSSDNTASITAYMGGAWRFGNVYANKTISAKTVPYGALVNKDIIRVAGNGGTSLSDVNDFETVGTVLLGGSRAADGSLPSVGITGKVFWLIIKQNGERVLELRPVVSADGVYRFWDYVSKSFFDSVTDEALEGGNL